MNWVLNPDRVGIFRRLEDSKFQTDGATELNERSAKSSDYVLEFSKTSGLRTGGCVKFGMCRAKLKGKKEVYCRSDGTEKVAVLDSQRNFAGSHYSFI